MECESLAISRPGDESQLERVSIYGYSGAARSDRDDTPTGILRDSFGEAYPTALFRRRTEAIRARPAQNRLRFFGFDIDPLPGGGYEDLAEILTRCPPTQRSVESALAAAGKGARPIDAEIARLRRNVEIA